LLIAITVKGTIPGGNSCVATEIIVTRLMLIAIQIDVYLFTACKVAYRSKQKFVLCVAWKIGSETLNRLVSDI